MPITFQPKERSVLMCDFRGYETPEIIKMRPVVVFARHRHNSKLVTVVPISSTEPTPLRQYHHELSENPLPDKPHIRCWAKCDLVATVSMARLDRYVLQGERVVPSIGKSDFEKIRLAVAHALSLPYNPTVPE